VTSASGSLLLTGDIERRAESALLATYQDQDSAVLKSDVMVVPHHGSKTSSAPDFIEAVAPSVAIFTVGYLNRFRHPRPEVVTRYQEIDAKVLRSDYHGAVTLNFHKTQSSPQIEVNAWRNQQKRYWHAVFSGGQ